MTAGQEREQTKPVRRIEYKLTMDPPFVYTLQANTVVWETIKERSVYTALIQNLARTYIPNSAAIPNNPLRNPIDTYLDFKVKGFNIYIANTLARQLAWVLYAVNGNIAGKRILDLGCGSTGDTKEAEEFGYMFQPWLCRTLLELGAQPIGVDIGELEGERFEAYRKDLLLPKSLDFLLENSIDIVHSRALLTSPELCEPAEGYLIRVLEPQVMRVIKPNGAFVYSKGW